MRKINLIAIIILPVIFLTSCLNIEPVKVGTVQDFSIGKITSKDVTVFFTVPIENPNKFSFKITKVHLEISLGKQKAGLINKINKVVIPAHSKDVHKFETKINFSELGSDITQLAPLFMKNKANVKLKGYIKVRSFPISKKINVENESLIKLLKL
ncbi:MAG: hypothetical protein A2275_13445 [Bacteroidetes bacterium RIFOXYA12_FULL_35_11]|nr:MAG: hypothetical protein A2X01_20390 [Bacteroidetes bacterium GWF2_35_48]OFY81672.1 MAG: hypothetical protein A2275_13445 [Bacteroidetes bacterium RIFOXYA12_FULL_35_11]OFZ04954.1 MAG: hypothetical protein A2491_17350 [Bacteroidetes bacterium RIFOXYC12_FULL_35_7]